MYIVWNFKMYISNLIRIYWIIRIQSYPGRIPIHMFFKNYIETESSRPGLVLGVNGGPDGPPPPPLTLPTDQGANRPYSSDGPVMEIICPDLQKNII